MEILKVSGVGEKSSIRIWGERRRRSGRGCRCKLTSAYALGTPLSSEDLMGMGSPLDLLCEEP